MLTDIFLKASGRRSELRDSSQRSVAVSFKESDDVAPLRRSSINADVVVQHGVSYTLEKV